MKRLMLAEWYLRLRDRGRGHGAVRLGVHKHRTQQ